jgi:hypothetical protein
MTPKASTPISEQQFGLSGYMHRKRTAYSNVMADLVSRSLIEIRPPKAPLSLQSLATSLAFAY